MSSASRRAEILELDDDRLDPVVFMPQEITETADVFPRLIRRQLLR